MMGAIWRLLHLACRTMPPVCSQNLHAAHVLPARLAAVAGATVLPLAQLALFRVYALMVQVWQLQQFLAARFVVLLHLLLLLLPVLLAG